MIIYAEISSNFGIRDSFLSVFRLGKVLSSNQQLLNRDRSIKQSLSCVVTGSTEDFPT